MFFYASKLFWLLAAPTNLLLLLLGAGVALGLTRWARGGRKLAAFSAVFLLIGAFSPVGALLLYVLEQRFAAPPPELAVPAGIIVLGGGMNEGLSFERQSIAMTEAGSRMTAGASLARRYPLARLVFSGGSGALAGGRHSEADAARWIWTDLGVDRARMEFEDTSRNTFENAENTKAMVQPKSGEVWLLVTSAWHMPRAMGIFRGLGFEVTPFPVDYRTRPWPKVLRPEGEAHQNLHNLDLAAREWIGLAAYRLSGRTNALFPAP